MIATDLFHILHFAFALQISCGNISREKISSLPCKKTSVGRRTQILQIYSVTRISPTFNILHKENFISNIINREKYTTHPVSDLAEMLELKNGLIQSVILFYILHNWFIITDIWMCKQHLTVVVGHIYKILYLYSFINKVRKCFTEKNSNNNKQQKKQTLRS